MVYSDKCLSHAEEKMSVIADARNSTSPQEVGAYLERSSILVMMSMTNSFSLSPMCPSGILRTRDMIRLSLGL
jgi:hypothetical protein